MDHIYDSSAVKEETTLLNNGEQILDHENAPVFSKAAAFLVFLYPALGSLLFGYDIGATSAVILQIQSVDYSGVKWYNLVASSSALQGTITSLGMLGAMLGCMICLRYADSLGRRHSIILASILYFMGSAVEGMSGVSTWNATQGITVLMVGRLIYGLGCGFAMQGAPAYIGEMAPSSIRGLLVSLKEAFIVLGMLLGYSVGYAYSTTPGGWRITYGWASVGAVAMCTGTYYLPSSAPWLAMKGRLEEALDSLRFVFPAPTQEQIAHLTTLSEKAAQVKDQNSTSTVRDIWHQLSTPTVYPALLAGIGLVVFQQVTGQPSVLYYADTLFRDVGVSTAASIGISAFKLTATLLTTFTVDKYGRKKLLYVGCALMLVALLTLSVVFAFPYASVEECNSHTVQRDCPATCRWDTNTVRCNLVAACSVDETCTCCTTSGLDTQKSIILGSLFVYIGGYQVGFGPIVWLLISEIFPLEVRGRAVAIAVVTNFFLNTVMTLLFPIELHYLGPVLTFLLYAAVLLLSVYFIVRHVPETKGLSLEEIERNFIAQWEAKEAEEVFKADAERRRQNILVDHAGEY